MSLKFPLSDVLISNVKNQNFFHKKENLIAIENEIFLNQSTFYVEIEEIGEFKVCNGKTIDIINKKSADENIINLFLNGSILGAILHQRQILPFHGSSFRYNNTTIMVCGDSGAGKSTTTMAFCIDGASFLTDDVTPIIFCENKPFVWAISDRLKLWKDSLQALNVNFDQSKQIRNEEEKYYVEHESFQKNVELNCIFKIEISEKLDFEIVKGKEKFEILRNEIYRKEYLKGMPQTEIFYVNQLADIAEKCKVIRLFRPSEIQPDYFKKFIEEVINSLYI
jgi:hypothetical protein